ncbi:mitochondrial carrier [Delitschia confertaspora ATCC 74209]|uniref:Mitochondrial carrier n=1 Tax=Delitschia confertaspora ATCC 74209 TaxID=1513339 RepID=A0A9P4MS15_9PLEO|nr:mitochondrial carrier [Delitschia confertaspora ATCC 74209]
MGATDKVNAAELSKSRDVQNKPIRYPFWFGGSASCFSACVTHPLDLVKVNCMPDSSVRLQTQANHGIRRNMLQMFVHVAKDDGFFGLYRGLSAALLRQLTYSMTRFGIYETLKDRLTTSSSQPSFPTLIAMASVSGFIGGVAGNPGDILNVRMQHDAALPPAQRRNYKNALHGLVRIAREEGVKSLWRGVWPNSTRAVLMTASQLATYDGFKRTLLNYTPLQDGLTTHFTASVMAGFVATTVCSPADVIKTRVMSATDHSKSIGTLLKEIYAKEGLTWAFRGWVPSFIRLGPHTILTFLFLEEHKKLWRKWKNIE